MSSPRLLRCSGKWHRSVEKIFGKMPLQCDRESTAYMSETTVMLDPLDMDGPLGNSVTTDSMSAPGFGSPVDSEACDIAESSSAASNDTAIPAKLYSTTLQDQLAQGLRRLSQWAHMRGWSKWSTQRITPTQLKILGLLAARAQGLSSTQVARELGVSPATLCDSVKALRRKGYVIRQRDSEDARRKTLRLTPEGGSIALESAASDPLLDAFVGLTAAEQGLLQVLWMKMIHALESDGALPPSRTCVRCQFFRPFCAPSSDTPHMCLKVQHEFAANAARLDCEVFEAANAVEQNALWEAFVDGTARGSVRGTSCS